MAKDPGHVPNAAELALLSAAQLVVTEVNARLDDGDIDGALDLYADDAVLGFEHRQDAERRDRILASLEEELRRGIESGKLETAKEEREATDFRRGLDASEMPPLRPFVFTTDYSPGDFAALLQSGGIQLLDLETLTALRNDETIIRWGLSRMTRYTKLSDELIVPNLDQDISFLYDSATKKLRKRFEFYPEALDATVTFANELERTHTALLKRIEAERQHNH